MKKLLLGSTALAAVGLLAPSAMAADPIKVTVSGYFQAYFVFQDHDDMNDALGNNTKFRTDEIKYEDEIWFGGITKLDNGTNVGFRVELEGYTDSVSGTFTAQNGDDQIDEEYIFFSGNWGRVEFGSTDAASTKMVYSGPSALPGFGVTATNFSLLAAGANQQNNAPRTVTGAGSTAAGTSDPNKISYFTPRFSGLQVGVSYIPEFNGPTGNFCASNGGNSTSFGACPKDRPGQFEYGLDFGVNYVQKFDTFNVALYGAYFTAKPQVSGFNGASRRHSWATGAQIGFGNFLVGGGLGNDNNALQGSNDTWWYNAGLTYTTGPWQFGGAWWGGRRKEDTSGGVVPISGAPGKDTYDYFEIAGNYTLGPGIRLNAGVVYYNTDGQVKNESADVWGVVIGTDFRF